MNPYKQQSRSKEIFDNPRQDPPTGSHTRSWLLPLLLTLIAVIVGAIVLFDSNGEIEGVTSEVIRAIGPESAPVTITEYADFGCISCRAWHQFGIREQVLEHYGEQVRFVWRDFPVTTSQSPQAAEAGFCAHDQGQFWAYHKILFANAPALGEQNLKAYAAEIGLDTQIFNACLESGEHRSAVELERTSALEQGFRSVPSFMVNDQRLIGPPSYDQLITIIDEILALID
jgi:protein-disulfide isomerase